MNKAITILVSVCLLCGILRTQADSLTSGQWRLTNSINSYFDDCIETKDRIYVLGLGQIYYPSDPSWSAYTGQLFVYDKTNDELTGYNASNYLNNNTVRRMAYNRDKGYLLLVYTDYTMDLLYDDDSVVNIPGLASSSLSVSKEINSIVFDASADKVYMATDFGYIIIDDRKSVISESRIYNRRLTGLCRVGDNLVAADSEGLYISPLDNRHADFSSFTKISGVSDAIKHLIPIDSDSFGYSANDGFHLADIQPDGSVTQELVHSGNMSAYSENRDGYYLRFYGKGVAVDKKGNVRRIWTPKERQSNIHASWDMSAMTMPVALQGLETYSFPDNAESGTLSKNVAFTFPQPDRIFTFGFSDKYGTLVGHNTMNRIHTLSWMSYPGQISAYKDGLWTNYGRTVSSSPLASKVAEIYGAVYDPVMEDYCYMSTRRAGMFSVDMRDNSICQFADKWHGNASTQGYYPVFQNSDRYYEYCDVSLPSFDDNGTLWVVKNPCVTSSSEGPFYYWTAADRQNGNTSGFKPLKVPEFKSGNDIMAINALKHPANRNIVMACNQWAQFSGISILNHGGTLADTADDKYSYVTSFTDQDGTNVQAQYVNCLYEDMSTGRVWVGTSTGLFSLNPNDAVSGGNIRVQRVKVARNDGTNLADYLLDGADVMDIKSDGAGRKWFATLGNGVVVTSAEGSQILAQFTTDNSQLPSDQVYQLGVDPRSNAIWMGTSTLIATYYSDASQAENSYDNVRIFPNPVRPDYLGDVTIDGLVGSSLVKIVDANGGLVRELGTSNGGRISWNLTNTAGKRVATGVYYVMASTSGEQSEAYVGKILVVR